MPENRHSFNLTIVGSMGLLVILERDLGLSGSYLKPLERRIRYQGILAAYISGRQGNLFEMSFKYDPDGVSEELLKYRDQLILAGWNKEITGISSKIDFLADLEKHAEVPPGPEDRWMKVLKKIETAVPGIFGFKKISLNEKISSLHPFLGHLFTALSGKGIIIGQIGHNHPTDNLTNLGKIKTAIAAKDQSVELDPSEKTSFQILKFKTESDAAEFVASQHKVLDDAVIINRNNMLFDEMLNSFGLPVAGSDQVDSNPMLIQLIRLISTLLVKPVQIHNLMSYLQVEVNPVPASLRKQLLKAIKDTGGTANTEWLSAIDEYEFKDAAHKESVLGFLRIRETAGDQVDRADSIRLYRALQAWAQRLLMLKLADPSVSAQLAYLMDMCKAAVGVLEAREGKTLTSAELGIIINGVYEPDSFINYTTQTGSCRVIQIPGQLIDHPGTCIWLDCYNEEMKPNWYTFLNKDEKTILAQQNITIWDSESQTLSAFDSLLSGILIPKNRCVLILAEQASGETVTDHPVFSQLKTLIPFIEDYVINSSDLTGEKLIELGWDSPATSILNSIAFPEKKQVHVLQNGNLVPTRPVESASSIELLIPTPFDWLLQYGANIQPGYSYQLDDLATTKGNVAHKLIEVLFNRANNETANARILLNDFDSMLLEIIHGYGMLLLLDENHFEFKRFSASLRSAAFTLLNLLDANGVSVTATESVLTANMASLGGRNLQGKIDLVLRTSAGHKAIFDLKWSRKPQRYIELMSNSRHIQLAIYQDLLQTAEHEHVDFVAYYSLSDSRLITAKPLTGESVVLVTDVSDGPEILAMVNNSLTYRSAQINNGVIEEGEGMPVEEQAYFLAQADEILMPLETESGKKKVNSYSSYKVFKGDII